MKRILISFLICVLFAGCNYRGLPSLNETYSYLDKNPFGTYVLKKLLGQSFPKAQMKVIGSFNEIAENKKSIYFSVSQKYLLSEDEIEILLNYVMEGNVVFISAYKIEPKLLNILDSTLSIKKQFLNYNSDYTETHVSLVKTERSSIQFNYYYNSFDNYFINVRHKADIIGANEFNEPNFIKVDYGKGKFFFHSDPRAFSNYFLLTNDNCSYLEAVLKIFNFNPAYLYWVSLSNRNFKSSKESAWDKLMKQPALANAIWIVICLLIAYIIFESRRKQRIIPVAKSNKNNSIEFARVISGLYLAKKDNKNISLKMISYFNEYCRNKFFIKENISNQDPSLISGKTGKSLNEVKELIDTISVIENTQDVSDELLISLQNQIHNFHK